MAPAHGVSLQIARYARKVLKNEFLIVQIIDYTQVSKLFLIVKMMGKARYSKERCNS